MSEVGQRLWAVRGAVQVERNDGEAILAATGELMRELIARNELEPERMVSCVFTATGDLNAEFPAVAARGLGLSEVPLICAREIDVPGSLPRIIRVIVHYYADATHRPTHAYLGRRWHLAGRNVRLGHAQAGKLLGRKAADAVEVLTDHLSLDAVVDRLEEIVRGSSS